MFKEEGGGLISIKCLDLQYVRRARPTVDLVYLFGTSTSPEFREEKLEEMLRFYHESLVKHLERLGYPRDTYAYDNLLEDYRDSFAFGFVVAQFHSQVNKKVTRKKQLRWTIIGIFQCSLLSPEDTIYSPEFGSEAEREAMLEALVPAQTEAVRKNGVLKRKLVRLAEEAEKMGIV